MGIPDYHGFTIGVGILNPWSLGGRGAGVHVAEVKPGFHTHEDLCNILVEPGQTPDPPGDFERNHGTSQLGILVALDNGYGWTGLVPDATAWFFPTSSVEEGGRATTAIANAISSIGRAGVIAMPTGHFVEGIPSPSETVFEVWLVTRLATDSDVLVVAAAGNGGVNLDDTSVEEYREYKFRGDSGAIIAGGGLPETAHRRWAFSNYGERVNVQGWAKDVFTLSDGDYWKDPADENDIEQWYTHTFGGTSAATGMVAACVASLQSVARANFSATVEGEQQPCMLTPVQARRLLIDTGRPQGTPSQGHIGPFPYLPQATLRLRTVGDDDCNENGVDDLCDTWFDSSQDCNGNLVPDECDLSSGTVGDCNTNGVPDDCEDCNENGLADECDIDQGTSTDCNHNDKPDECDDLYSDCNENGVLDLCDIDNGTSEDCNGNEIPDECESLDDCNTNGIQDICEPDCNANLVADECDITSGTSNDCDENEVPDECQPDCDEDGIPDACEPTELGACCVCFPLVVCHSSKTTCECDDLGGQFQGFGSKCTTVECCTGPNSPQQ